MGCASSTEAVASTSAAPDVLRHHQHHHATDILREQPSRSETDSPLIPFDDLSPRADSVARNPLRLLEGEMPSANRPQRLPQRLHHVDHRRAAHHHSRDPPRSAPSESEQPSAAQSVEQPARGPWSMRECVTINAPAEEAIRRFEEEWIANETSTAFESFSRSQANFNFNFDFDA